MSAIDDIEGMMARWEMAGRTIDAVDIDGVFAAIRTLIATIRGVEACMAAIVDGDPIDRVSRAIADAPSVWMRTDKFRQDGRIYEIGINDEEDEPCVLAAFADYQEACDEQAATQLREQGKAAFNAIIVNGDSQSGNDNNEP